MNITAAENRHNAPAAILPNSAALAPVAVEAWTRFSTPKPIPTK